MDPENAAVAFLLIFTIMIASGALIMVYLPIIYWIGVTIVMLGVILPFIFYFAGRNQSPNRRDMR